MEQTKTIQALPRHQHSAEFKAQVVGECEQPGASVAAVALSHSINANLLHRWRRLARAGRRAPAQVQPSSPGAASAKPAPQAHALPTTAPLIALPIALPASLPLALPASSPLEPPPPVGTTATAPPDAIHIQLHCGPAQLHIHWPTSAALECAGWLRQAIPHLGLGPTPPSPEPPELPELPEPTYRPSLRHPPHHTHKPSTRVRTPQ